VNIYFCRGLSGKNQRRSTCQIYIERNRSYYEKEYSRRLEKIFPRRGGPRGQVTGVPAPGPGRPPHLGGQSESTSWIMPSPPLRIKTIVHQGRFDPRDVVLPRGQYKQGPSPGETLIHSIHSSYSIQRSPRATISIRSPV
jgi:hypothetical protein